MRKIGSQIRETLEESGMEIHERLNSNEVILVDEEGKMELWVKRDDFAGYVIEILGKGYEFITSCPDHF